MTAQTDRRVGLTGNLGMKAPCIVGTTENITLSGLQTIDGIALAEGDRVLVSFQTTGSENGVYNASTGTWTRAVDWDGTGDVLQGSTVVTSSGTLYAGRVWQLATTNPVIGTSSLTFNSLFDAANLSNTPAGSLAATTVQDALNELDTEKEPRVPAGTRTTFNQAAAPTGWTQDVSVQEDSALRVVTVGSVTEGGTHGLTAPPSTAHVHSAGGSHTHDYTTVIAHVHTFTTDVDGTHLHDVYVADAGEGAISTISRYDTASSLLTQDTATDGAHSHAGTTQSTGSATGTTSTASTGDTGSSGPTAFSPKYIDVIMCSRDA